MKTLKYILSIVVLFGLITFAGCKKDSSDPVGPDPLADRLTELMNGGSTWDLVNVTKDGYDVSDQFNGFKLTIGEFTYSTTNALATAWPVSGIWAFNNDNPNSIVRDNDVIISTSISNNQLTLSFSVTGLSGGRLASVDGDYVFTLQ